MRFRSRANWVAWGVALLVPIGLAFVPRDRGEPHRFDGLGQGRAVVRVEEIGPRLVLSGVTRAAQQTTIIPEVELLAGLPTGSGVFGITAPTRIIELVPEGTPVDEGDVICRLDPSAYEEAARLQRIEVDRCRSFLAEAQRALSVAEAELVAFRDGDRVQQERQLETELAFARVELSRAEDYLTWADQMGTLGYVAPADLAEDRLSRLRAEVARNNADVALRTFLRTTVQKQLRSLEATVERSENQLQFATEELRAAEQRLDHVERQVAHCTMAAPHDGAVFYADISWREYYQVREGADVYPHFPLFVLPDLSSMEVELQVHERFSSVIAEGQEAIVSFEAFPGRSVPARVTNIDLLPTPDWYHFGEWQQFRVRLALDGSLEGLLPDMTAEVDLKVGPSRSALTVPSVAVFWDEDGPFCSVESASDPAARRPIRVDRGTADLLVVLDGLEAGDTVLLP